MAVLTVLGGCKENDTSACLLAGMCTAVWLARLGVELSRDEEKRKKEVGWLTHIHTYVQHTHGEIVSMQEGRKGERAYTGVNTTFSYLVSLWPFS